MDDTESMEIITDYETQDDKVKSQPAPSATQTVVQESQAQPLKLPQDNVMEKNKLKTDCLIHVRTDGTHKIYRPDPSIPDSADTAEVKKTDAVNAVTDDVFHVRQDTASDYPTDETETTKDCGSVTTSAYSEDSGGSGIPKLSEFNTSHTSTAGAVEGQEEQDMSVETTSGDVCQQRQLPAQSPLPSLPYKETVITGDGEISELKLRDYQKEVSKRACSGENDIIILPTGTGKTYIAIKIIQSHLVSSRKNDRSARVCILVPSRTLAAQQLGKVRQYISQDEARSEKITGEDEKSNEYILTQYVQKRDSFILVLTPAMLENYLKLKDVSISDFSLLIFDECHHARDKDKYSPLLKSFFDYKTAHPDGPTPQLVGMTASIGVGSSKTKDAALDYIMKIFARFNLKQAPTPVVENVEELKAATTEPVPEYVYMTSQQTNDFIKFVEENLMEKIESLAKEKVKEVFLMRPDLKKEWCLTFPANRMHQSYGTHIHHAGDGASKILIHANGITEQAQFIVMAIELLQDLHEALSLVRLLQPVHSFRFIESLERRPEKLNPQLWGNITGFFPQLEKIASRCDMNPLLQLLKERLEKQFASDNSSKVIIFVTTKLMARHLAEWLQSVHEAFKAKEFMSSSGSSKAGVSHTELKEAIEGFREGRYNILVSTSVVEEGIDVPACNMVIKYMYSKDLLSKVQGEGRARVKGSCVLSILDKSLKPQVDSIQFKEELMTKALNTVQGLSSAEFHMKVTSKRDLLFDSSPAPLQFPADSNVGIVSCKLCGNKLGLISDIRAFGTCHIILDSTVHERVVPYKDTSFMDGAHGACVPLGALGCGFMKKDNTMCKNKVANIIEISLLDAAFAMWRIKGVVFLKKDQDRGIYQALRRCKKYGDVKKIFRIRPIELDELREVADDSSIPPEVVSKLREHFCVAQPSQLLDG